MSNLFFLTLIFLAGVNSAKIPSRIIGGDPATIEEYPSIVSVEIWFSEVAIWSHNCGGSILNNRYILSAAHCFDGPIFAVARIRLGSTYSNVGGTVISVDRAIIHPNWDEVSLTSDICLVYLSNTIVYSNVIQRATIPSAGSVVPNNAPVIYAGWGFISSSGPISEYLRHIMVFTVDNRTCRERYGGFVNDDMICAGLLDVGGKDVCSTDSGGPMYYNGILVGVISFGTCINRSIPSVSTKVSSYTDWIERNAV